MAHYANSSSSQRSEPIHSLDLRRIYRLHYAETRKEAGAFTAYRREVHYIVWEEISFLFPQ